MNISIIGSGNVGQALGQQWSRSGHHVVFGARNPESPKTQLALQLIEGARVQPIADALHDPDVVVICTPPEAVHELISELRTLSDVVIIDATNSVRTKPDPYPTVFHALRAQLPEARVVKCFNTTGFENMKKPISGDAQLDMFMAGDDEKAKSVARQLSADCGFGECYNFGGDDKVQLLEQFALSWINLAIMQGYGRDIAFRVVRRG